MCDEAVQRRYVNSIHDIEEILQDADDDKCDFVLNLLNFPRTIEEKLGVLNTEFGILEDSETGDEESYKTGSEGIDSSCNNSTTSEEGMGNRWESGMWSFNYADYREGRFDRDPVDSCDKVDFDRGLLDETITDSEASDTESPPYSAIPSYEEECDNGGCCSLTS